MNDVARYAQFVNAHAIREAAYDLPGAILANAYHEVARAIFDKGMRPARRYYSVRWEPHFWDADNGQPVPVHFIHGPTALHDPDMWAVVVTREAAPK